MDKLLLDDSMVRIGSFSVSQDDAYFNQQGHVTQPLVVFPKNSIWIQHEGKQPFVADTSLVNFYNRDQHYNRFAIDPQGDHCHWFAPSNAMLDSLIEDETKLDTPFTFENVACPEQAFLLHLFILKRINANMEDILWIQESCLGLLKMLITPQSHRDIQANKAHTRRLHRQLVENTKQAVLDQLDENLSLQSLAKQVNASPYHLSRIFKRITGQGISDYRIQQRLRTVVLELQTGNTNLMELAMRFGFSSHSHLSACFKQHFGMSPSNLRSESIA